MCRSWVDWVSIYSSGSGFGSGLILGFRVDFRGLEWVGRVVIGSTPIKFCRHRVRRVGVNLSVSAPS